MINKEELIQLLDTYLDVDEKEFYEPCSDELLKVETKICGIEACAEKILNLVNGDLGKLFTPNDDGTIYYEFIALDIYDNVFLKSQHGQVYYFGKKEFLRSFKPFEEKSS